VKTGESLGSYTLIEELGRGPSASTWLAKEAEDCEVSASSGAVVQEEAETSEEAGPRKGRGS